MVLEFIVILFNKMFIFELIGNIKVKLNTFNYSFTSPSSGLIRYSAYLSNGNNEKKSFLKLGIRSTKKIAAAPVISPHPMAIEENDFNF